MEKQDAIRAIHMNAVVPAQIVIAMAGNGTEAISDLMKYGRGSNTLLGQFLLYSNSLFDQYLGYKPQKYVSEKAARDLATSAYRNAIEIIQNNKKKVKFPDVNESDPALNLANAVGIGCTSSLVKPDGERDGRRHEIYIAVQNGQGIIVRSIELKPGSTREMEERLNADLILATIAEIRLGTDSEAFKYFDFNNNPMHSGMVMNYGSTGTKLGITPEIFYKPNVVTFTMSHSMSDKTFDRDKYAVFPGSFNPMHDAHREMIKIAEEILKVSVIPEISIINPDKPFLDQIDLSERIQLITRDYPVFVTNIPLFANKAKRHQEGTSFVMGVDTYNRLFSYDYYQDIEEYTAALLSFVQNKTKFIVFCRKDKDGNVATPDVTKVPKSIRENIIVVPPERFLIDMSSTDIRAKKVSP